MFDENYLLAEPMLKNICNSRLRAGILFSLDEPMALCDLRRALGTNAPNTSAKAKDLEKMGLVERDNGDYRLTKQGMMVKMKFKEFSDTLAMLDKFDGVWSRIMDGIPVELLDGIDCLLDSRAVENSSSDLDRVKKEILKLFKEGDLRKVLLPAYSKEIVDAIRGMERVEIIADEGIVGPDEIGAKPTKSLNVGLFVGDSYIALTSRLMDCALVSKTKRGVEWGSLIFGFYKSA